MSIGNAGFLGKVNAANSSYAMGIWSLNEQAEYARNSLWPSDSGPPVIQTNLVYYIDPGNSTSYPGTGTTVNNLMGGSTSSLINGVTFSTNNRGIFVLDGSDDAIVSPAITGIGTSTNSITWCLWVRPASTSGNIMSMSATNPQGSWNMPPITASSSFFTGKIWNNNRIQSLSTYSIGTWYFIAFVFDYSANAQRLYVNSVLQSTQTGISYSSSGSNNFLFFGQANPGADNAGMFAGSYGPITVYVGKALTQSEIDNNFSSHRGRFGV